MAITWRRPKWEDIEPGLSIPGINWREGIEGVRQDIQYWRVLFRDPFFMAAVLESNLAIQGHHLIGFGAAVLVSPGFADAEVARPRPDIASRIIASVRSGSPVLATRNDVARANACHGIDVMILCSAWRDDILSPAETHDVEALIPSSFADAAAGLRIRRIVSETANQSAAEFHRRSVEYTVIAEFPELGRSTHLMTHASATAMPGSLGNVIFRFTDPVLRLRDSDRNLLLAALNGATDEELAAELGVTLAAVKARWRSTFALIAESIPNLAGTLPGEREVRGAQKRHRVLAYVRTHKEELRPYAWKAKTPMEGTKG